MASCVSVSVGTVPTVRPPSPKLKNLSNAFSSFKISTSFSQNASFSGASVRPLKLFSRRPIVVIVAATKKPDSAEKRHRQSEKRRIYHKSHKSEMRTRMKKVLVALEKLRKSKTASAEDVLPIEKLIAEAYSAIDKAVRVGAMHKNTGAHRKSRLARRKKAIEIFHGWYKPELAAQKIKII